MKIVTLSKEEFEEFSNKNSLNTFYQSVNYANFAKNNNQYDAHYLGFVDNTNSLIGASLVLYKTLFWGYKAAYAPRGFLFKYDDATLVTDLTESLKRLLKKQKFIFITIDPPIVVSERDKDGNTIKSNPHINNILTNFKKNGFEHVGFNLYNESKLSRFNVSARLNSDARIIYNNFSTDVKEKINYANSMAITVSCDETCNINKFSDYIKSIGSKKSKKFLQNIYNAFSNDNKIKIFYAKLDTQKYTKNANDLYTKEEEKNNALGEIIQSGDNVKYNIQKAINDKMESDKLLHTYKKDIVASTRLLKNHPDGIICGAALTIQEAHGVNILINIFDEAYTRYNIDTMLNYEIMKYFGKENFQYINLGDVTGNFNSNSKFYPILTSKLGFNSSILEYIGEFDIVLNPTMYRIYKKKYNIVRN